MRAGYFPGVRDVAKKSGRSAKSSGEPAAPQERVEFVVDAGWTAKIDESAERLGLSRSAFIRLAVVKLMQAESKAKE